MSGTETVIRPFFRKTGDLHEPEFTAREPCGALCAGCAGIMENRGFSHCFSLYKDDA
jgi:hypothetical protein